MSVKSSIQTHDETSIKKKRNRKRQHTGKIKDLIKDSFDPSIDVINAYIIDY